MGVDFVKRNFWLVEIKLCYVDKQCVLHSHHRYRDCQQVPSIFWFDVSHTLFYFLKLFCRIDHWDNERERIIVLCDWSILFLNYDFITQKLKDYRRILLHSISEICIGDFVYPEKSLMQWVMCKLTFTRTDDIIELQWDRLPNWFESKCNILMNRIFELWSNRFIFSVTICRNEKK